MFPFSLFKIKLTPFYLFFIILIVLIAAVFIGKYFMSKEQEGFADTAKSMTLTIRIPQYSKNVQVTKLYDKIFFDEANGNIIITYGTSTPENPDYTGSMISKINVIKRDGSYKFYDTVITPVKTRKEGFSGIGTGDIDSGIYDSYYDIPIDNVNYDIPIDNVNYDIPIDNVNYDIPIDTAPTTGGQIDPTTGGQTTDATASDNLEYTNTYTSLSTEYQIPAVYSSYTGSWTYPNSNAEGMANEKYQIVYIPWGLTTFIHIIDLDSQKNVATFFFGQGGARYKYPDFTYDDKIEITAVPPAKDTDVRNNSLVVDPIYDIRQEGSVYQLSRFVRYDRFSGKLIIYNGEYTDPNQKFTVYDRINGNKIGNNSSYTTEQQTRTSGVQLLDPTLRPKLLFGLNSWIAYDKTGNNMVLYIGIAQSTMIVLLQKDSSDRDGRLFSLVNVKRFDGIGNIITNDIEQTESEKNTDSTVNYIMNSVRKMDTTVYTNAGPENVVNPLYGEDEYLQDTQSGGNSVCGLPVADMIRSFSSTPAGSSIMNTIATRFNSMISGENTENGISPFTSDYLLKTQIVPPVCPSCASNQGECTTCGKIGSSTSTSTTISSSTQAGSSISTVGSTQLVYSEPKELAGNVYRESVNVLGTSSSNLSSPLYDGQQQLMQGAVYSGQNSYQVQDGSGQQFAAVQQPLQYMNTPVDNYSYYGALKSKGDKFIPVTADFSRFGR